MVSTRQAKSKVMDALLGRILEDILPIMDFHVCVCAKFISSVYVDGGAHVYKMIKHVMHFLDLRVDGLVPCKTRMANNSNVHFVGVINTLKVKFLSNENHNLIINQYLLSTRLYITFLDYYWQQ